MFSGIDVSFAITLEIIQFCDLKYVKDRICLGKLSTTVRIMEEEIGNLRVFDIFAVF